MKPNAAMAAVPLQAPAGAVVSSHDTPANETGKDNVAGHSAPLTLEQRVALSLGYIQALSALCDGAIVGSAFVEVLDRKEDPAAFLASLH